MPDASSTRSRSPLPSQSSLREHALSKHSLRALLLVRNNHWHPSQLHSLSASPPASMAVTLEVRCPILSAQVCVTGGPSRHQPRFAFLRPRMQTLGSCHLSTSRQQTHCLISAPMACFSLHDISEMFASCRFPRTVLHLRALQTRPHSTPRRGRLVYATRLATCCPAIVVPSSKLLPCGRRVVDVRRLHNRVTNGCMSQFRELVLSEICGCKCTLPYDAPKRRLVSRFGSSLRDHLMSLIL